MDSMKYIVANHKTKGESIFIFPMNVNHDAMWESLRVITFDHDGVVGGGWYRNAYKLVSAGFIEMTDRYCYGKSETLGISSRSEDIELLTST